MSELQVNNIQPISGQALTIKDEGGTASITVATNGEATFAENIIVGTAGKGIDFSNATDHTTGESSVGSVLDDYEEGTWTPTLNNSGSCNALYARYRKVGNIATVWVYLENLSTSSYSGTPILVGTPLATLQNHEYVGGSIMGRTLDITSIATITPYIYNNNFYFYYTSMSNGNWGSLNWSHLNTSGTSDLIFFATYPCQ